MKKLEKKKKIQVNSMKEGQTDRQREKPREKEGGI